MPKYDEDRSKNDRLADSVAMEYKRDKWEEANILKCWWCGKPTRRWIENEGLYECELGCRERALTEAVNHIMKGAKV